MASISPGRPRRYPVRFYVCAEHENRGAAVCGNDVRLRQDLLDHAVLQALSELLDERMIDAAVDRALKRLRAGEAKHLAERTQIERELGLIEHRIQRSLDAYLNGEGPMPEVRAQLGADKARKSVLVGQLAAVTTLKLDRARLQARAADVRALLGRHVPQARQMLRRILAEPIRMTPVVEGSRKGFRFEGRLAFDGLLGGAALRTLRAGTIAAGSDLAEGFIVVPFCGVAMAA